MATQLQDIDRTDTAEMTTRRDLAAFYRLVAYHGWDDLVATHISARVPGRETFLINPFGILFEEITPESLVEIDGDGNKVTASPHEVNRAAFVIHSAVHAARPEMQCVAHLHTKDGVAVSALEEGLLPLNQTSILLQGDVAIHEYEGVAVELAERERLAADLGTKNLMLLRNHGTLALGPTIADTFTSLYFLETACTTQVRTLSMGRPIHPVSAEVIAKVTSHRNAGGSALAQNLVWPAMLRKIRRLYPDFPFEG